MKTKISIFTSTRADYGLLKPLITKLKLNASIEVRLFVTGTHLSKNFGETISEIEKEHKNEIYYRVEHILDEDLKYKNLKIMADAMSAYSDALVNDKPDLTIILGDRYEAFCYGLICASLIIPIVHLHGGELTLGAIDDKFRHCLTKLSEWHFVACDKYRKRVIQLGESPDTVFNVGALGIDNALNLKLLSKDDLEKDLKVRLSTELYLFTYHPETNSADYGSELLQSFLISLEKRLAEKEAYIIVTGVNNDPGSSVIRDLIQKFISRVGHKALYVESLGVVRYLSLLKLATAVLGNSSSGVLEAFTMKTPTANIGLRQAGRERESSVVDFPNKASLLNLNFDQFVSLKKDLQSEKQISIFGSGCASELMASQVNSIVEKLNNSRNFKEFFDLP